MAQVCGVVCLQESAPSREGSLPATRSRGGRNREPRMQSTYQTGYRPRDSPIAAVPAGAADSPGAQEGATAVSRAQGHLQSAGLQSAVLFDSVRVFAGASLIKAAVLAVSCCAMLCCVLQVVPTPWGMMPAVPAGMPHMWVPRPGMMPAMPYPIAYQQVRRGAIECSYSCSHKEQLCVSAHGVSLQPPVI